MVKPSTYIAILFAAAVLANAIAIKQALSQSQTTWMEIGISFNRAHRSIDAIQYSTPLDCAAALAGMKARTAQRPVSNEARMTFEPRCIQTKPTWWTD